jgi:hypothetical protein
MAQYISICKEREREETLRYLLDVGFLLVLLFSPEDGDMFLRNVIRLSPD